MGRYVLRRLGFLVLTLLLTSMIVFGVTRLLPGDVARVMLGREAGEAALERLREELGLNDPWPVQYLDWLRDFIMGDWGRAYTFIQRPEIRPLVLEKLGNSWRLAVLTLMIAVPISVLLGVLAGLNEHKLIDSAISISALSVVGLPEFVTGLVLIQVFAHGLGLLPGTATAAAGKPFWEALPELILPAIAATLVLLAYIARLVRAGVIEELKKPYVRTAVLKGLPRRIVIAKHILRNALLPTITVVAISFSWLIGGLIVIEYVFNYRGLGLLLFDAIDSRDFPLLQAITMVIVVIVVLANLVADLLYALLNPRIRLR
jgi:peptide/nickel transport system permease protein